MAMGSRAAPDTSCVTPGKIQCWCGPPIVLFFLLLFLSVQPKHPLVTSPFKIYAATPSAINHAHAQWAAATRPIHHGVGVGVGGAPAAGDSAHVAAYGERWRCIISSASCGRRQPEQDRPAAPGHSVVNSLVGCQAGGAGPSLLG